MRFLMLFLIAVAVAASAARADVTAVYRQMDGGRTVRIEVSRDGDARFAISDENWQLFHVNGVSFAAYELPKGPLVVSLSDLQQLASERGGPPPAQLPIATMSVVERGETTIGAYTGTAYHLQTPVGLADRPQIVISRDSALAGIGAAWVRQVNFSIAMLRSRRAEVPATIFRIREILSTGTPLLYAGHSLESVTSEPIPSERFHLPAPPMNLYQLRRGEARQLFGDQ
jgi:hypothetical protein